MANSQINTQLVTMAISRGLYNDCLIAKHFDPQFNKEYKKAYPVGATIYPRLPWRFQKKEGLNLQLQPLVDRVTSVTMDQVFQYSTDFDSVEEALTMPRPSMELIDQIAKPVVEQLSQDIDSAAALWVLQNTPNVVGNLGTAISDLATLRGLTQKLVELGGWRNPTGVLTPGMANSVVGLGQTFMNPQQAISKQAQTMEIGKYANITWNQTMSLYAQTAGTAVTSITVTGAGQSGSSLIITGTSTQTLLVGDKIGIGSGSTGMYAVNPATRRSFLAIRTFTVTQSITLTGGADTVQISPSIIGPGNQYQNVDALPQDGAAVVLWPGTTSPSGKQGMCGAVFANDAFCIVGTKLAEPDAVEYHAVRSVPGLGIDCRITVTWDAVLSRKIFRCDTQFGFGNVESENKSVLLAASV